MCLGGGVRRGQCPPPVRAQELGAQGTAPNGFKRVGALLLAARQWAQAARSGPRVSWRSGWPTRVGWPDTN
eukprot:5759538-Alexandrium_andersonii.AAC.1